MMNSRYQSLPVTFMSLVLITSMGLLSSQRSFGQPVAPNDTEADRDAQFEAIEREVAALERHGNLLKRVVRLVTPTVVHIEAQKNISPSQARSGRHPTEEAGSGVIIRIKNQYFVLTNRHVIKDSSLSRIKIQLADGRETRPTNTWADKETDVAVMKISATNLVPARLGSSRRLEIGDFVLAVGSPFGLSHSVTYGIISAKGRRDLQLGDDGVRFQDFIQTDAAINPGNSGGPLLNLRGEVVGLNTAIASNSGGNEGIGFSIPIDMVMIIARQLIENGKVVRAFLGVHLDSQFGAVEASKLGLPRPTGARVSAITPSSPAAAAKLKVGDVILEFDSINIEDDDHLVNLVSLTPVDKAVPLIVYREGKNISIRVKVGDRGQYARP